VVRIMSHVKILLTILFIAELTSLSFFAGCIKQDIQLEGVEVREYQGEKLSSVNDFSENSIKGPQYVNKTTYQLKITGLVKTPKNYTYDEVLNSYQHYKKVVTLDCVEGWSVTILWEGILVLDIIDESEPLSNATVVIFKAIDGYTTSFPLNYIQSNNIILRSEEN